MEQLEQICATLEALVTDLSRRLAALEERERFNPSQFLDSTLAPLYPTPEQLHPTPERESEEREVNGLNSFASRFDQRLSEGRRGSRSEGLTPGEVGFAAAEISAAPNPQYAPVYALLDEGMTDAQEIARRTGLSRGEVDLILGLRARQVL